MQIPVPNTISIATGHIPGTDSLVVATEATDPRDNQKSPRVLTYEVGS